MAEQRLNEMVERTAGYMIGTMVSAGIQLGDTAGLYGAMVGAGPLHADEVAERAECNRRLVREWLDGQSAAGLIDYDGDDDRYTLSEEAAMVLAVPDSPAFLARGIQGLGAAFLDMDKIVAAYQGDGGLAWHEHHPCLFRGVEWFFRPGYRTFLTADWIPALKGVEAALNDGAVVADIGCGHGASLAVMAEMYSNSSFVGVDFHAPSVEVARQRVDEAGVGDRCQFQVADSQTYEGTFDLICFFDCLHDMGDPVGALRHARDLLAPGGSVMLVEPYAMDGRATNIEQNPFAAMLYHASSMVCTPNSLSQPVGRGLGAQAGVEKLREVFAEAGFAELHKRAETPFNLILQGTG